jgi:hypothetical protein
MICVSTWMLPDVHCARSIVTVVRYPVCCLCVLACHCCCVTGATSSKGRRPLPADLPQLQGRLLIAAGLAAHGAAANNAAAAATAGGMQQLISKRRKQWQQQRARQPVDASRPCAF